MTTKKSRKLNRIADKMIHKSMRNGNYSQVAKYMDMSLKIDSQNSLYNKNVNDLMKINIVDMPVPVLKKWYIDLKEHMLKNPLSKKLALEYNIPEQWLNKPDAKIRPHAKFPT